MSGGRPRYVIQPGQSFGRWVVISSVQRNAKTWATCRCECGVISDVMARNLALGRSKSCGCHRNRKHGQSCTMEFRRWNTARQHGVMCKEWQDFEVYLAYVSNLPGYGVPNARLSRVSYRFPFRPGNVEWRVKGQPATEIPDMQRL